MAFRWMEGKKIYAPSWLIIGISIVLMAVVIVMGMATSQRERKHTEAILREKGAALIWSFEAGMRTGMMGLLGNQANLQILLEQTVFQSGVSYIVLVGKNGEILAHSDKKMVGKVVDDLVFNKKFQPVEEPLWRTTTREGLGVIFEVYKVFLPMTTDKEGSMTMDHFASCPPEWLDHGHRGRILDPQQRPAIVIGMDVKPFEDAMSKGVRSSTITAGMIFLLALTGVVSLFWVQSYLDSRKLLKDVRALASEIVRNLPEGIVVVGNDGLIRYINGVACTLLDIAVENVQGRMAEDVLPKSLMVLHDSLGRGRFALEKELNMKSPEGAAVPVNVSVIDIVGEEKQYVGFMFVLKNLSELRHLETQVRQREKLAAIGNLAAGIAHEVRNPLSSIKGYVSYLGSLFPADSENRKISRITTDEVDRVNRVISELLEFARPADLKLTKTSVPQLIEHALDVVSREASAAGVEIKKRIDAGLPEIRLDPDRFMQVLLNILINAIQSMEQGGEITVAAGLLDNTFTLTVTDSGSGIPAEDQESVFNPYFTTKKTGTGLGMAIVHKIVENHGGTVSIRSQEGSGTTVVIQLPLIA